MKKAMMSKVLISGMFIVSGIVLYLSLLRGILKQYKQFQELNIKAQTASEAKSNFLAKTSHEIRTPMNAIIGMTELLLRRDIPHDAYQDVLNIKQAGANLLAIINDILDFSKIESGKIEIIKTNYQLSSLLNDVINIIRMRITEKPIRFTVNVSSKLPNHLIGDVVRIRQVLLNLLSNAVKYTYAGHISLTVAGEHLADKKFIKLYFAVSDTGIGIKQDDLKNLFMEFMQVDVEKNQGVEGTGLGLAIGKNLCRLMNGDITVDSTYGKGSVFTAVIPQEIANTNPVAYVPDAETKSTVVFENRMVNLKSICASLQNLGAPVTPCSNPEVFFRELRKGTYAFAFVPLPIMQQTLEVIEKQKLQTVPVLLAELGISHASLTVCIQMPAYALPIANVLNGITETQDSEKPVVRFSAPDARVLIVDDISANLTVAKGLLSMYQVVVDVAANGPNSIELAKQNAYDMIFMDHMMPGMDGIEAAHVIRTLHGGNETLPIIALTANAVSGMKEMFLQSGFNDYLSKPIEIPKVDAIMDKWIPQSKKRKETSARQIAKETMAHLIIPGVDTQMGRAMSGGSETGYRLVLAAFAKDAEERLELLSSVPNTKNLPLFTACVHALKSASATIGAVEISKKAALLEAEAKGGNLEIISLHLNEFHDDLVNLSLKINKALDAAAINAARSSQNLDQGLFAQKLKELCAMIKSKNIKNADKTLLSFEEESCSADQKKIIDTISDYVLMGEYESAVQIIDSIVSKESGDIEDKQ
jgi:signal transduction histidine kinase/CheY-like chemotaxis protein